MLTQLDLNLAIMPKWQPKCQVDKMSRHLEACLVVPVSAVSGGEESHEGQHQGHPPVRVEHLHLIPEIPMLNCNLGETLKTFLRL